MIRHNPIIRVEAEGGTLYYPNTGDFTPLSSLQVRVLQASQRQSIYSVRLDLTNLFPGVNSRDFDNAAVELTALDLFSAQGRLKGFFYPYTPTKHAQKTIAPLKIFVELTQKCNLSCSYCFNNKVSGSLALSSFSRIVRQAEELGIISFTITGGEPTLRQNFDAYLNMVGRSNMQPRLITNAVHWAPLERNAIILQRFTIIVSLHYYNSKAQPSFYLTNVLRNIRRLVENGLHVVVNLMVLPSFRQVEQYLITALEQLREIKVAAINVTPPRLPFDLINSEDGFRLRRFEEEIAETLDRFNSRLELDLRQKSAFCSCHWRHSFGVLSHGDVVTCGIVRPPHILGNIDQDSLLDIVNSKLSTLG